MPLVIFIDDSPTALAATQLVTKTMPIEVKHYTKAQDALEEIKGGSIPDLIITDFNMPIMNGFEFLEQVRAMDVTRRTPCLMLTTETKKELKEQGKSLGLTGWIVKPFNPAQLQQAIVRVLRLPV